MEAKRSHCEFRSREVVGTKRFPLEMGTKLTVCEARGGGEVVLLTKETEKRPPGLGNSLYVEIRVLRGRIR